MENPKSWKDRISNIENLLNEIVNTLHGMVDGCIELTKISEDVTELDRQILERHFDALKKLLLKQDFQSPANLAEFSEIVTELEIHSSKGDRFKKPIEELRNGIMTLNKLKGW